MSELYNCVPAGTAYRITKFDKDYNVTSSYLTTDRECECPQGHKETCRHRKVILPAFKQNKHIGDGWFFVFASRQWLRPMREVEMPDFEGSAGSSPPPADASVGTPSPQPSPPPYGVGPAMAILPEVRADNERKRTELAKPTKPANWRRF